MWQDHGRRAPTTVSTGVSVLRAGPAHTKEDGLFIAPFAKQDQAPRTHVRIHVEAGLANNLLRPGKTSWAPRLRTKPELEMGCRSHSIGQRSSPKRSHPHDKMWKHVRGGPPPTSARRPDLVRHAGQDT